MAALPPAAARAEPLASAKDSHAAAAAAMVGVAEALGIE